jgi:hypothetical protein
LKGCALGLELVEGERGEEGRSDVDDIEDAEEGHEDGRNDVGSLMGKAEGEDAVVLVNGESGFAGEVVVSECR